MQKITKLFFILAMSCLIFGVGADIRAQENEEATQELALDEEVSSQDLGINEPKLLPDSPFYFLKNWVRKIQSTLTFNKVKKAELENKYANEKLIELKKLVEKNADPEKIKKATENYQNQIEKIKEKVEQIKEKAADNQAVDKFLDKFVNQQILQEKILQKLEEQVPTEALEKIKEAREQHLVKFGEVMTKLEDRAEKIKEKIENALEEGGSQFKNFKNLEILKNIEEKIPEQAKEAIQQAQENALNRLKENLENMSLKDQEKFKDYIDNVSGDKEKQLQILESLKTEISEMPAIQMKLNQVRERVMEKVMEKAQEGAVIKNCPLTEKPSSNFCPNGRIVPQKDEKGCIIEFKCVIPAETQVTPPSTEFNCIALWDPVCGKDGKTYSNKCFVKLANVEVAYQGECKTKECEKDNDCPQVKCGANTTSNAKCLETTSKCVDGKCVITSATEKTEQ
ncbi:hypothetical protein KKE19_02675 [Patescibacteria group bacterium]|nr:hypothetical protein [Patescibacteria group bacterium]MBU4367741.1 hypothetical protein [Patescibacteria group bacterium]MBU4461809.1 hypothetical protein [Patescibacteria group bacterium]MCG2700060.1 DUF5667 domain-containing protein [Candidatus Parcubacteria bacterium]